MQKASSLQDIMNDIAGQKPDAFANACQKTSQKKMAAKPLDELHAFMRLDPLLADLHKQYMDAKDNCAELVREHGADDVMVDVAMDMEDSAWCAMQTRYLEVRAKRDLMEKAQHLMRVSEQEIAQNVEADLKQERKKQFDLYLAMLKMFDQQRQKERRLDLGTFEALFVMFIFKLLPVPYPSQAEHRFSMRN
jgi:Asp-tRNA(Asn)/Glu-tRNA(Gln) amidotransferase A subunit family amidase